MNCFFFFLGGVSNEFFFTIGAQLRNNFLLNNFRKRGIVLIHISIYPLEYKNSRITIFSYFINCFVYI